MYLFKWLFSQGWFKFVRGFFCLFFIKSCMVLYVVIVRPGCCRVTLFYDSNIIFSLLFFPPLCNFKASCLIEVKRTEAWDTTPVGDLHGAQGWIVPQQISALWMACLLLCAKTRASGDAQQELKGLLDFCCGVFLKSKAREQPDLIANQCKQLLNWIPVSLWEGEILKCLLWNCHAVFQLLYLVWTLSIVG